MCLCLCMFSSLRLSKYDRVLSRGRGQWLLGWVPPAGKAFWTLLTEGLGKMNRPWPVIQSQAQHGLLHSTNVLWKHIVSSSLTVGALLIIELRKTKIGRVVCGESREGKEKKNETTKNILICSCQFSLHPGFSIYFKDQFFLKGWVFFGGFWVGSVRLQISWMALVLVSHTVFLFLLLLGRGFFFFYK